MPKPRQSIAQRRIGLELRQLRNAAGKTLDEVGALMEWSPSKVSRVETGESRILVRDVRLLCKLLDAEPGVADALSDLVKASRVKGWWEPYRDVLGSNYIPFEFEADEINEFQMEVVPGLLQTSPYIRAIMRGARRDATEEEIERRVQMRLERREVLDRDEPVRLWMIMSEGALCREIGGRDVLQAQLKHLVDLTERPNIDIQVLPFEAGAHPAVTCTFTVFRYEDAEPLVFGNGVTTNPEIEDPTEKQRVLDAFEYLRAAAENPERSRRIIEEAAKGR